MSICLMMYHKDKTLKQKKELIIRNVYLCTFEEKKHEEE